VSPSPVFLNDALQGVTSPGPDRIDVWAARVSAFTPLPAALGQSLTAEEVAQGRRFVFEADRQRFCVARGLLRAILGAYSGTNPGDLRFTTSDHGKPRLDLLGQGSGGQDGGAASLEFNVSHSGDAVLIAVATGRPVGVDIEQMKLGVDLLELARSCFTPVERAVVFADADGARHRFYQYWACKEAWMKADGRGLSLPLTEFSLVAGSEGSYRIEPADPREWQVRALRAYDGYAAAVAAPAGAWSARVINVR
jgi:4'-phosphopantetheinyl transferase